MAKLLREPLLHFAVLGFALFLAYGWLSGRGVLTGDRIVITQGRVEQLAAGFEAIHQRTPTASEMDGMIEEAVREEIYSREAKSMGLDQDDTIIRRRLMTKLQFLSEDTTPVAEPTDAQLQEYLDAHAADFRVERHYSFTHVYLSPQRHGEHLGADVQALLAQLRQRDGKADAAKLGDPFLLELRFDDVAASELAHRFGADFETALRTLPTGEWSGPVPSSYGTHSCSSANEPTNEPQRWPTCATTCGANGYTTSASKQTIVTTRICASATKSPSSGRPSPVRAAHRNHSATASR